MPMKAALAAGALVVAGGLVFWLASAPGTLPAEALAGLEDGDAARGERVFWAGGCASCHAAEDAEGEARLRLGGGLRLETPFGDFVAPNISPHADGIGGWSDEAFANAMLRGVSPDGRHYYPSFPYTSYARMRPQDVVDLHAFMQTLPAVEGETDGHALGFPYAFRRGIGLWKRLNMHPGPVVALGDGDEAVARGRYLVEGPGHCGECHTPRDGFGGLDLANWLAGAAAAEGDGVVPNITPSEDGLAGWSAADIAYYLESGFTPSFDTVGGAMVAVQENMAELPAEDRQAIAAYLKAIPGRPDGHRPAP
ncbi:cytochrome c [Aquibium sp. A9E412]|uniref:cytochrome c n=1 Tax=Aquibium sp. A9E412 TaxID=2976767 RepID=UPI0025B114A6|nr:cytochrome c [Aquibium sp. A9E412]MDN2566371.1 cytochrome c [Aquibium sp. A9E412]